MRTGVGIYIYTFSEMSIARWDIGANTCSTVCYQDETGFLPDSESVVSQGRQRHLCNITEHYDSLENLQRSKIIALATGCTTALWSRRKHQSLKAQPNGFEHVGIVGTMVLT